ncbi:MAG: hypothetical protein M3Y81_18210 [Chloroflexota bacterium]|nr:hypothetical protein [Chloroflexota bacterium]
MKQKMRNHIFACGQVIGFLTRYATLSQEAAEISLESVFMDYCLDCEHFEEYGIAVAIDQQEHAVACALCERYQLFVEGWNRGQSQAQQAFEMADLAVIEIIGTLAGWTTRRSPRTARSITAEHDAAVGGFQGEVWQHFITSWRQTGGDRRRIKGV